MATKVEQYIAETCKMEHNFTWMFKSKVRQNCANSIFIEFLQYTALSAQPATPLAVMREAYSHHYGCLS